MSDAIVYAQGVTGSLEFYRDRLVLKKKGWPYGHKNEKSVPIRSISALQIKQPGLTNGFIQVIFSGSSERGGGTFNAVSDENSVVFSEKQKAPFLQIRDYVEAEIAKTSAPSPTIVHAAPVSLSDELGKLATLRDQGILTDEEFQTQKARLLG